MLFRAIRGGGEGLMGRVRTDSNPSKQWNWGVLGKPVGVRIPPSGTMLEAKGIRAITGVPFFIGIRPLGKYWGSLE